MLNRGLRGNLLTWTSLIQALESLGCGPCRAAVGVGSMGGGGLVSRLALGEGLVGWLVGWLHLFVDSPAGYGRLWCNVDEG